MSLEYPGALPSHPSPSFLPSFLPTCYSRTSPPNHFLLLSLSCHVLFHLIIPYLLHLPPYFYILSLLVSLHYYLPYFFQVIPHFFVWFIPRLLHLTPRSLSWHIRDMRLTSRPGIYQQLRHALSKWVCSVLGSVPVANTYSIMHATDNARFLSLVRGSRGEMNRE